MKRIVYLITILLFLSGCSEEVVSTISPQESKAMTNINSFYDSITAPGNWSKYQSLEEMLAACQLPESTLKALTTDQLIQACVSHPLRLNYVFYNNEIEGAEVIIKHFNGFKELKTRKDAPEKIINFYENVSLNPSAKEIYGKDYSSESYLSFLELVIASKFLPALFEGSNKEILESVYNKVLAKKLKQSPVSQFVLKHTLLVGAQIKLADSHSLSNQEINALENFVYFSKPADSKSMTNISLIISK